MAEDLDEVDRSLLSFTAAHDLVLSSQLRYLADEPWPVVLERIERLSAAGLMRRGPRFSFQLGSFSVTRPGLARLGSDLPLPRGVEVRRYWRDLGLGWIWTSLHKGAYGEFEALHSRRVMRALDASLRPPASVELLSASLAARVSDPRFAMRCPSGRVRYPGIAMVLDSGRYAFELALRGTSRKWLDDLLGAYAANQIIRVVVVMASTREVAETVEAAVAHHGLVDRVQIRVVKLLSESP